MTKNKPRRTNSERRPDKSLSSTTPSEMEQTQAEILRAIDEILDDSAPAEYDPANPGLAFTSGTLATSPEESRPLPTSRSKLPRVGTVVQRSDADQARKRKWLLSTPPPLPRRRPATTPPPAPKKPTLQPARVMGPEPPPPIPVEVAPGIIVDVPHFAAHVSRKYKARVGNDRYIIRFNHTGTVRFYRKL